MFVGVVLGVGLVCGVLVFNLGIVRNIVVLWIVMLFVGVIFLIIFFYIFKVLFGVV